MKLIAIGDLHGKDCWKQIGFNQYDKVVFMGDYTDSFTATNDEVFINLSALIQLKKSEPAKFVLLLGNHDIQYMYFPDFPCTGFRPHAQVGLTDLFRRNTDCFDVAYQYRKYLFTHAGVSKSWHHKYEAMMRSYISNHLSMGKALNALYHSKNYAVLFDAGKIRGGPFEHSGIVWADAKETQKDHLDGIHQVAGHTPVKEIITVGNKKSSITYIDVLDFKTAFYELTL